MPSGIEDFVGLSRRSVELMAPHLPADARIHELENIIDLLQRPRVAIRRQGTLLYIGRLDPEKGIRILLEAADRTAESIVFVGEGPLRAEVEASGRHRVTGWKSAAEVQAELDSARCLLFPSQWYETYGLVVSEASARGVPSIVSDVSAAAERVRHGETGLIFKSGNVEALTACLIESKDAGGLDRLGAGAYDSYWANPPDRKNHTSRLLGIYDSVLEGHRGAVGAAR